MDELSSDVVTSMFNHSRFIMRAMRAMKPRILELSMALVRARACLRACSTVQHGELLRNLAAHA